MNSEIISFFDLQVYQLSHKTAMEFFWLSKSFPVEERYSLTDQIRRSSRSISANIAEGWGKRLFENVFKRHLIDAMGSLEETKAWLHFCVSCGYIEIEKYDSLMLCYTEIGSKLWKLHENWRSRSKQS
ncbi:MAG: four helix bundle protein [Bacteroidetes bacterium]|nr:four helix bundle protein [Bacteroidota bacterium]